MSSINFNALSKAAFVNACDIEKSKMSFDIQRIVKLGFIDDILDTISTIKKYQDKNNNEFIVKLLKDALSLCYISNINLNNYIKVEIKDEDNSTVN